ncbi:MAG: hypothetical protein H6937_08855 [Burkholderiales bacterium]|nr:hypothetical protein [Burkholderiales bacterium]MDR4515882.1 hypothetical protein [Nitrosomonas sp.]
MFEYRQIIVRMRLGDSDRALARAGLIGRSKAKALRQIALQQGWLDTNRQLPDDEVLAQFLSQPTQQSSATTGSCVEPYRDTVAQRNRGHSVTGARSRIKKKKCALQTLSKPPRIEFPITLYQVTLCGDRREILMRMMAD